MKGRTRVILIVLTSCLLAGVIPGVAQKADSVKSDTIKNKYLPTGIRIGYDLIGQGKSIFQDNFSGWEVQGDVDFNRYFFVLEVGNWGRNLSSDSSHYTNSGSYWRVGADVNFLTKDKDRNMFFLGLRYGRSVFSETLDVMKHDRNWGLLSDTFQHSDVTASWVELTTGLKVKIWKTVWLGYTARFKFALSDHESPEMIAYDVPGFGLTDKETTWGFNYYILMRFPVRKQPPVSDFKKR